MLEILELFWYGEFCGEEFDVPTVCRYVWAVLLEDDYCPAKRTAECEQSAPQQVSLCSLGQLGATQRAFHCGGGGHFH